MARARYIPHRVLVQLAKDIDSGLVDYNKVTEEGKRLLQEIGYVYKPKRVETPPAAPAIQSSPMPDQQQQASIPEVPTPPQPGLTRYQKIDEKLGGFLPFGVPESPGLVKFKQSLAEGIMGGGLAGTSGSLLTTGGKAATTKGVSALSKALSSLPPFAKAFGAGAAGAGAIDTAIGAVVPDKENRTRPEELGASLRAGTGGLLETLGGSASWFGSDKLKDTLKASGQAIREGFDIEPPEWEGAKTMLDPQFYTVTLGQSFPATVALMLPAFLGYKGLGSVATKAGAGEIGVATAKAAGGALGSRPLEAALEAGSVYEEAIERGRPVTEANRAAWEAYGKNMLLLGSDAAQYGLLFAHTPFKPVTQLGKAGMAAGKLGFGSATEGGEEIYQDIIQRQALDDPVVWDARMEESGALGGVLGGLFGAGGVVNDVMRKSRQAESPTPTEPTPTPDYVTEEQNIRNLAQLLGEEVPRVQSAPATQSWGSVRTIEAPVPGRIAEQGTPIGPIGTPGSLSEAVNQVKQEREGITLQRNAGSPTYTPSMWQPGPSSVPVQIGGRQEQVPYEAPVVQQQAPIQQGADPVVPAQATQQAQIPVQQEVAPQIPAQQPQTKQPQIDVPAITEPQPERTVQTKDGRKWTVIDDVSDPAKVQVRSASGAETWIGRKAIAETPVQQPANRNIARGKNGIVRAQFPSETDAEMYSNDNDYRGYVTEAAKGLPKGTTFKVKSFAEFAEGRQQEQAPAEEKPVWQQREVTNRNDAIVEYPNEEAAKTDIGASFEAVGVGVGKARDRKAWVGTIPSHNRHEWVVEKEQTQQAQEPVLAEAEKTDVTESPTKGAKEGGKVNVSETEKGQREGQVTASTEETTPPAPKEESSKADKLRDWLEQAEQDAWKRLESRKGRIMSGLPMDDFVDYAIIGATKLSKRALDFAAFSKSMLDDIRARFDNETAETVSDFMPGIYAQSQAMLDMDPERIGNMVKAATKEVEGKAAEAEKEETEPAKESEAKKPDTEPQKEDMRAQIISENDKSVEWITDYGSVEGSPRQYIKSIVPINEAETKQEDEAVYSEVIGTRDGKTAKGEKGAKGTTGTGTPRESVKHTTGRRQRGRGLSLGDMQQRMNRGDSVDAYSGQAPTLRQKLTDLTHKSPSDKPLKRQDILDFVQKELKVPLRSGNFRQKALGIFKRQSTVIRTKKAADLPVIAHEVGHRLDEMLKLSQSGIYNAELEQLGQATSKPSYPAPRVRREGVAEFTRLYLTDEQVARSGAPNFYKHFEQSLDTNGLLDTMQELRGLYNDWINLSARDRLHSITSTGGRGGAHMTKDQLYAKIYDELRPVEKAVEQLTGGKAIAPEENPFMLAWKNRGVSGKAEAFLNYGIVDKNGNKVGKSLKEIINSVKDIGILKDYIMAKHIIELHGEGKTNTPLSVDEANEIINDTPAEYDTAAKELVKFQDTLTDALVDSGIVKAENRAAWRKKYQYYVPFYRVFEESGAQGKARGYANLPQAVKKMKEKGSARDIIDPLESIIKNTFFFISLAEQNNVGRALADLADDTKDSGFIMEKVTQGMQPVKFSLDEIAREIEKAGGDISSMDETKLATLFRPVFFPQGKENILTVWRNGKSEFYQIGDPDLYRALLSLDREVVKSWVKLMSIPANIMRAGTALNPAYIPKNPTRDIFSLIIQSDSYTGKTAIKIPFDLVKSLFSVVKKDDMYWKWRSSGGAHATLVSLDRDYLQENLRNLLRKKTIGGTVKAINPLDPRNLLRGLRYMSESLEETIRLAEFRQAYKKTGNVTEAAVRSRDISIDFNRLGTDTRVWNRLTAFFNASIQGPEKAYRTFKKNPWRTFSRSVLFITIPSLLLFIINKDDPDYEELPRWRKDLFWNIPMGGGRFFPIPKPFEYGVIFGSLPERICEYINTNDKHAFDEFGKQFLEAFTPPLMPNAFIAPIEWATNYKFFPGYQIVSEYEKGKEPAEQYGPNTTGTAKWIGKTLDVSPRKVDVAIQDTFGGLGKVVTKGIDQIFDPNAKPFSVFSPRLSQPASVERFYDELAKANREHKKTGKKGSPNKELVKLRKTADELSDIRKKELEIYEKSMSPEKRRAELTAIQLKKANAARKAIGKSTMR